MWKLFKKWFFQNSKYRSLWSRIMIYVSKRVCIVIFWTTKAFETRGVVFGRVWNFDFEKFFVQKCVKNGQKIDIWPQKMRFSKKSHFIHNIWCGNHLNDQKVTFLIYRTLKYQKIIEKSKIENSCFFDFLAFFHKKQNWKSKFQTLPNTTRVSNAFVVQKMTIHTRFDTHIMILDHRDRYIFRVLKKIISWKFSTFFETWDFPSKNGSEKKLKNMNFQFWISRWVFGILMFCKWGKLPFGHLSGFHTIWHV